MEEQLQEESQEKLQEQSPDDSPKKSSGRMFLIVGLAVVVLAGAGGFLFLRRAKAATPHTEEGAGSGGGQDPFSTWRRSP